jgi:hypothetical protein
MNKKIFIARSLTLGLTSTLMLVGCQSAKVANPMPAEMLANFPEQQMNYWHSMADRNLISNNEAFHGLLLYVDGKDDSESYEARVQGLKGKKILPASFNEPSDNAVTRGTLAVAMVHILHIRGGASLSLFPDSPRYAVRELMAEELYPVSSEHQTFSGPEFIGVIGRAEDYERSSSFRVPAADNSGK